MGNIQIKLALLVFSLVCAGCTTPFVEVTVNGEGFSKPTDGGGPGCVWPCYCPNCATFETSGSGQEAKVLLVEKSQDVYHLQGADGQTIRVVLPQHLQKYNTGDVVLIKKEGTEWTLSQKK